MAPLEYSNVEAAEILGVSEEELLALRRCIGVESGKKISEANLSAILSYMAHVGISAAETPSKKRGRPPKTETAPEAKHQKPERGGISLQKAKQLLEEAYELGVAEGKKIAFNDDVCLGDLLERA